MDIGQLSLTMVIILVNFKVQRNNWLSCWSKDPAKSIPIAVRNVTWRIVALYIIPITLLISILPWDETTLTEKCICSNTSSLWI